MGLCSNIFGGAWSEITITHENMVFIIPKKMDLKEAAAFPIVFGTSHVAISHRAKLKKGEFLLIHGGKYNY
jgi:NADPH:quinone reductase